MMGKGDKRTRRGKIWRGTYGKTRPKKIPAKVVAPKTESTEKKPESSAKHPETGKQA
jgi:30S ribosomal protein S31